MPWKLTVRTGPRVERERHATLDAALAAAERRAGELAATGARAPVDLRFKRIEPHEQVRARLEISGPERLMATVRAGIDVRGDGSTEAYLGRVRREPVKQRGAESAARALRRALDDRA